MLEKLSEPGFMGLVGFIKFLDAMKRCGTRE